MWQMLVTGSRVFFPLKRFGSLMFFIPHLPLPNWGELGPSTPFKISTASLQAGLSLQGEGNVFY